MNTDTLADAGRLAVSSWSWHAPYYAGEWSLLDLPGDAAAAGLTAVEGNDFMLPPPRLSRIRRPLLALLPGAPPELWRYSRGTLRRLAARAAERGVLVIGWTINSDFAVPVHHWPAQRLYLRRGAAAARMLGAGLLRVNLGGTAASPAVRDELIAGRLAHFASQTLPRLALTVENHWGVSTDIDRHLAIFDRVVDLLPPELRPRFGCCFDPANMAESPRREGWWRELAARANHFHLKTAAFTAAGRETSLPHPELFALLRRADYRGWITIEYAGEQPAAEGIRRSIDLWRQYWDQ